MQHVSRLKLLNERANSLSMAINVQYYRLGVCFEAYSEVSALSIYIAVRL